MKTRLAFGFVALMGLVSLFADVTYEGARGITGPYLAVLGASALAVGVASGLGEFAGYALRLVSGFWADKTRSYWTFTFLGYLVNLAAVPMLALAGSWPWAVALLVLERVGKAIRTPARDAILAQATSQMGHGKGFGLHELLDQIGAVVGPLAVAAVLARGSSFAIAFLLLGVPALAALATLTAARLLFGKVPAPQDPEVGPAGLDTNQLPQGFFWLLAFVALHLVGFAHFQLIGYHLETQKVLATPTIPLLFALAMLTDGIIALPAGWLFDRVGLRGLVLAPLLAAPTAFLAFATQAWAAALGVGLWGAALGLQETTFKAAIARTVPASRRGTAFGVFHAVSGLAWLAGSLVLSALYAWGYWPLCLAALGGQLAALAILPRLQAGFGPQSRQR